MSSRACLMPSLTTHRCIPSSTAGNIQSLMRVQCGLPCGCRDGSISPRCRAVSGLCFL
ncbi:hypothetical protein DL95DRAFT_396067, partial [Leptodontidium sp. 2 PMI_412]